MIETLNTPEITRLALIIGAFIATIYKNTYNVNPGGVIIPGLIVILFLLSPLWCISTLVLSFIVYFIYDNFLKRADYKRRTPMYILSLLSLTFANSLALIYVQLGLLDPSLDKLTGTLLPAVIAYTWTNQKMSKVTTGMVITTLATVVTLGFIYIIGALVLGLDFDVIRPWYEGKEQLDLDYPLLQFYIVLVIGYIIYRFTDIRAGGYLIAPVAAALLLNPLSAVIFLIGCIAVYFLTVWVCKNSLIVGLNRYALALFFSTMYVWGVELVFLHLDTTILPFEGSNIFVIIAIMSYVNDSILYAKDGAVLYMGITLLIAFATLLTVEIVSMLLI